MRALSRLDLSFVYAFLGEATLGLTLLLYILLARILGPEQYGVLASATALAAMLSLFIQFGFPSLMARDAAADPIEGPKATTQFLLIEGLNSAFVLLLLLPLARFLGFEGIGLTICYLAVLAEVGRSVKMTLRAVLRGRGWFRAESISVAIERSLTVLLTAGVLLLTQNLVWAIATLVGVRLLDNLALGYYLSRRVNLWSAPRWNSFPQAFRIAWPFALAGVLWVFYYQVDLVMLKSLAPPEEAGFYGAAYRVMEIFSALPRVIFAVFITKLSRCYVTTPEQMPQEIFKATRMVSAIVLPFLIVASFLQFFLVKLIYGDAFLPAVAPLAIILTSTSLSIFSDFLRRVLMAVRQEQLLPRLLAVTVVLNISVNAFLIPRFGAVGAASATLLSEIALFSISIWALIHVGYHQIGKLIGAIGLAGLLLIAAPALILRGLLPLWVGIGLMLPSAIAIPTLIYWNQNRVTSSRL